MALKPMDLVGADQGILTREEIEFLDAQIIKAIRPQLTARKFMDIFPLPNAGYMWARGYEETDMGPASISMYGDSQADDVTFYEYKSWKIPTISKTFKVRWRDILASRNFGQGLDVQYAENAGRQVAEEEDTLCLTGEYAGWPALGIEGLSTATGRQTTASNGNWPANAIQDINDARTLLQASGFVGVPFITLAPTALAKCLDNLIANTVSTYRTAILDNNLVQRIYECVNLFAADAGTDSVLVVQPSPMNFDILQAMPPRVGWWEYKDGNMYGYVRECVAPRIKRPLSIVEITGVVCSP